MPKTEASPLRVFFMGASYNISHNLAGLAFIVHEIIPAIRAVAPHCFEFHILGSKVPASIGKLAAPDLSFDGYVPNLTQYLTMMDIALMPSLFGVGMQQKVFESLCRGFPTITHPQALAGYPFEPGVHVMVATDKAGFVAHLLTLQDAVYRQHIALQAVTRATKLFSHTALMQAMNEILVKAVHR